VQLELLTVPDCPNRSTALDRLHEALTAVGAAEPTVTERVIGDLAAATAAGMHGSPTVLIDGDDPFDADGTAASLSCRLYRTRTGLEGSPSVDQLIDALSSPRGSAS
jgi:hypothetical protein